jgi:hypothetical protein
LRDIGTVDRQHDPGDHLRPGNSDRRRGRA